MSDSQDLEQNKQEYQYTSNGRVALIGLFGGLIWGFIGYIAYLLNFTKYGPALTLDPFTSLVQFKNDVVKQFMGLFALMILSIFIAFGYKWILGRVKTMWISIAFGIALWVLVFYILQPWLPGLEPVTKLDKNTITTTLCLYALYGLFVGYSISFDLSANDNDQDEKEKADSKQT